MNEKTLKKLFLVESTKDGITTFDKWKELTPALEEDIAIHVIANLSLFKFPNYRKDIIDKVFQKLKESVK
jgi:hypothetical protein